MSSKNLRNFVRTKLQNRYGVHSTDLRIKLFGEQMYYGHREVFINYLNLPKDAYFEALIPHGKIPPTFLCSPIKLARVSKTYGEILTSNKVG